ncbi:Tau-tubulin kinase 2, partial [Cladochytrium tenue]
MNLMARSRPTRLNDNPGSVSELRKQVPGGIFTATTTAILGKQMLRAIQALHDIGVIHRDVKPGNFCMSLPSPGCRQTCYLIDFGLSRRFLNAGGRVREELGRVDDLWSLFYLTVEFLKGQLPWKGREKERIGELKQQLSTRQLASGLHPSVAAFYDHLTRLGYADRPDYDYVAALYDDLLAAAGAAPDADFDWVKTTTSGTYLARANWDHSASKPRAAPLPPTTSAAYASVGAAVPSSAAAAATTATAAVSLPPTPPLPATTAGLTRQPPQPPPPLNTATTTTAATPSSRRAQPPLQSPVALPTTPTHLGPAAAACWSDSLAAFAATDAAANGDDDDDDDDDEDDADDEVDDGRLDDRIGNVAGVDTPTSPRSPSRSRRPTASAALSATASRRRSSATAEPTAAAAAAAAAARAFAAALPPPAAYVKRRGSTASGSVSVAAIAIATAASPPPPQPPPSAARDPRRLRLPLGAAAADTDKAEVTPSQSPVSPTMLQQAQAQASPQDRA